MQVVTTVTRAEYLAGKCITARHTLKNVKRLRVNVALVEFLNVIVLTAIGMYFFGFQHASLLGEAVSTLTLPTAAQFASFVFFATALAFLARSSMRLLAELATNRHALPVVADMNAWIKHISSGATGSTFNVAILTDSGFGMSLELYGTRAGGKPLMIAMTSSRYSRVYDRTSITDKGQILTRLASAHIGFPAASLQAFISAPASQPQPGSAA